MGKSTSLLTSNPLTSFLFKSSSHILFVVDSKGGFVEGNEKAMIFFGAEFSPEAPLAICHSLFCLDQKSTDCSNLRSTCSCILPEVIQKTFSTQEGMMDIPFQIPLARQSGLLNRYYLISTFYLESENFVLVQLNASDETNLYQQELVRRNDDLMGQLDRCSDCLWTMDKELNLVLLNVRMKERFHLFFGSWVNVGDNYLDRLPDQIKDYWQKYFERVLAGETITHVEEMEATQELHVIEFTFTPIVSGGQITGISCIGRTITAQRKSEMEAKKNLAMVLTQIESSHDHIWSVDIHLNILLVNTKMRDDFKNVFGLELAPGVNGLFCIPSHLGDQWQQRYQRALHGEHFTLVDSTEINGAPYCSNISFTPIVIDGQVAGVFCVATDITQQQLELAEHQRNKANLSAIVENTPDLIWSVDRDFKIITSNKNFRFKHKQFFNLDLDSPEGKSSWDLMEEPESVRWRELYLKGLGGEHFVVVDKFQIGDLGVCYYQISFNPIVLDGKVEGVVCFAHDITLLKKNEAALVRSESKFREAQEVAKIGSWDMDYVNNLMAWSDEVYRILDLEKGSIEPTIESLLNCIPEAERAYSKQAYLEHLKNRIPYDMDYQYLTSAGELKYVVVRYKSIFSLEGDVISTFGTIQDITEQKLVELALREANTMKAKLFSVIAHDLRSPFNALLGFAQLLSESAQENDFSNTYQYSTIIEKSAEKIFALLTNLLDWSNSQIGRNTFFPETVDLKLVVHEVLGLVSDTLTQKDVLLEVGLLPLQKLVCDKNMLSTILRNLITNSIKYSHIKGTIYLDITESAGEMLFCVKDQGVGINPKQVQELFVGAMPFTSEGTNHEKGTGLGLILCKDFVERHKGRIWVESEIGKGSNFYFTIPF